MKRLAIGAIIVYQRLISPLFSPSCRFHPTCSQYAIDALRKYSFLKACWKITRRISRCHPWGGQGYDPA